MENIKEPLERILAREWNQSLKPYEYHITPEINRLIDAGWVYKRMSMHGHWILGWTELGWAAATVCGLCEVDTNLILEMGAEIERQREEIAALRDALADAKTLIEKPRTPIENDYAEYAEHRQHFFWTLRDMGIDGAKSGVSSERRFVPNVRVKYTATDAAHRSGQLGVIAGSAVDYLEIEFEDGLVEGVKRTELQSV